MTADTVGGVWTYALELAHELTRHDTRVHLAVMGPPMDDEQRHHVRSAIVGSVHEGEFALEWMEDPWSDVDRAAEWLLELASELRPDIVHLNGYVHASAPWSVPVVVTAHSCVYSWWHAVHGTAPPEQWKEYRRRVSAGLGAAAAVVAPSAQMLASLERWYGYQGGTVIPNFRRTEWVREVPKSPLVVGAGRLWDEGKNLRVLAQAAPAIDAAVVIAGASPGGAATWNQAQLVGKLPQPALDALLLQAAVFAAPARYEPFGLAALEAAHAGCALVLGDIPTYREIWDAAALYVPPDDGDTLARTINQLLRDPPLRAEFAARARSRASAYRPDASARAYDELYTALLMGTEVAV